MRFNLKKLILIAFLFIYGGNYIIPDSGVAKAGVIKWGIKKVIVGSIKIIFSHTKDKVIEHSKAKLFRYLKNHPQYKSYAIAQIKKHINKYPHLKERGYQLLRKIR